ncbi:antagonist of like heterochromatin protein 1-like protein [Tanacetum coccineum]
MDQNNLNDFDPTDTYDHYDAIFQPDYDRYMRDHESYQHYVGLCEQEAGGSSDGPKKRRTYIYREREDAEQKLIDDYFDDDEYEPKYPKEKFKCRYRMSSRLFNKIFNDILSSDVQPLPDQTPKWRTGTSPDAFDEFLRRPTTTDIQKTYELHEEKHGLPGMLGSIDCMHWNWKNCPKSLHGKFKRSTNKYPTLMLEAVADQKLWIWHAYFGVPGANNDLNVLYGSPLFDAENCSYRLPSVLFVCKRA